MWVPSDVIQGRELFDRHGIKSWLQENTVLADNGAIDIGATLRMHSIAVLERSIIGQGQLFYDARTIYLNPRQDEAERLMTLGHEFGHFILCQRQVGMEYSAAVEAACDIVGMHMLLPASTWSEL
ncbi:ImmA/IrrE family metallo-endopeptidase [Candidatus Saccharibacteria bacterium]|nr:ImmA/IrrE family metallo-endopeptidase [Candidatus Saccharibacteria bacterium]